MRRSKFYSIVFFLALFFFFLYFYSLVYPPIMTTPDDWNAIIGFRDAILLPGAHNPTKILPEILEPFAICMSTTFFSFFCENFAWAISLGTSILLAGCITLYSYNFYQLIKKSCHITKTTALFTTLFFLLFHFLAFRKYQYYNPYLFGSFCSNCYYHYTIPILLNASLVMYCLRCNVLQNIATFSFLKQGIIFVCIYICLASNLYSSIIFATYLFFRIIFLFFIRKDRENHTLLKNNKTTFFSLSFFVVILWLESHGHNAQQLTENDGFYLEELRKAIVCYVSIPARLNVSFVLFCFFTVIILLCLLYNSKESTIRRTAFLFTLFALCNFVCINIFSILISAKAIPEYVVWQDRLFVEFFWIILCICFYLATCIKLYPKILRVLPLVFIILFINTRPNTKTYKNVKEYSTMPNEINRICEIAKKAEQQGKDSIILYVPYQEKAPEDCNWPYAIYLQKRIPKALYQVGVLSNPIPMHIIAVKGLKHITSSDNYVIKDSIVSDDFWDLSKM